MASNNGRQNLFHEECRQCGHSRNCINGVYCMEHGIYVQHAARLPCERTDKK